MRLWGVTTRYPGSDKASTFYFDTEDKAAAFLETCENGEITEYADVHLKAPAHMFSDELVRQEVNYSDGCTANDMCFGDFDQLYGLT